MLSRSVLLLSAARLLSVEESALREGLGLFPPESSWGRTVLDYARHCDKYVLLRVFDGPFCTVDPEAVYYRDEVGENGLQAVVKSKSTNRRTRRNVARPGALGVVNRFSSLDSAVPIATSPSQYSSTAAKSAADALTDTIRDECLVVGIDATEDELPPPSRFAYFTCEDEDLTPQRRRMMHPTGELYSPRTVAHNLMQRLLPPVALEPLLASMEKPPQLTRTPCCQKGDRSSDEGRNISIKYPNEICRVLLASDLTTISMVFANSTKRDLCRVMGSLAVNNGVGKVAVPYWLNDDDLLSWSLLMHCCGGEGYNYNRSIHLNCNNNKNILSSSSGSSSSSSSDGGGDVSKTNYSVPRALWESQYDGLIHEFEDMNCTNNSVNNNNINNDDNSDVVASDMCDIVSFYRWSDLFNTSETLATPIVCLEQWSQDDDTMSFIRGSRLGSRDSDSSRYSNYHTGDSVSAGVQRDNYTRCREEEWQEDSFLSESYKFQAFRYISRCDIVTGSSLRIGSYDVSEDGFSPSVLPNAELQFMQLVQIVFARRGYAGRDWSRQAVPPLLDFAKGAQTYFTTESALERLADSLLLSIPQYSHTGFMAPLYYGRGQWQREAIPMQTTVRAVAEVAEKAHSTVNTVLHHAFVYSTMHLLVPVDESQQRHFLVSLQSSHCHHHIFRLCPSTYEHWRRACRIATYVIASTGIHSSVVNSLLHGRSAFVFSTPKESSRSDGGADNGIVLHNRGFSAAFLADAISFVRMLLCTVEEAEPENLNDSDTNINTSLFETLCGVSPHELLLPTGEDVVYHRECVAMELLDALHASTSLLETVVLMVKWTMNNDNQETQALLRRVDSTLRTVRYCIDITLGAIGASVTTLSTLSEPYVDARYHYHCALQSIRREAYSKEVMQENKLTLVDQDIDTLPVLPSPPTQFIVRNILKGPLNDIGHVQIGATRYWLAILASQIIEPTFLELNDSPVTTEIDFDLTNMRSGTGSSMSDACHFSKAEEEGVDMTVTRERINRSCSLAITVPVPGIDDTPLEHDWRLEIARETMRRMNEPHSTNRVGSNYDVIVDPDLLSVGRKGFVTYITNSSNSPALRSIVQYSDTRCTGTLAMAALLSGFYIIARRHGSGYTGLAKDAFVGIRRALFPIEWSLAVSCFYMKITRQMAAPMNLMRQRVATGSFLSCWNDSVASAAMMNITGVGCLSVVVLRTEGEYFCDSPTMSDAAMLMTSVRLNYIPLIITLDTTCADEQFWQSLRQLRTECHAEELAVGSRPDEMVDADADVVEALDSTGLEDVTDMAFNAAMEPATVGLCSPEAGTVPISTVPTSTVPTSTSKSTSTTENGCDMLSFRGDSGQLLYRLAELLRLLIDDKTEGANTSEAPLSDPLFVFKNSMADTQRASITVASIIDWLMEASGTEENSKKALQIGIAFKGFKALPYVTTDPKVLVAHCMVS